MFERTNSFSIAKLLHSEIQGAILTNTLSGPETIVLSTEIDRVYDVGTLLAELPQTLPEVAIWAMGRLVRPDEQSLQSRVRARRARAYFTHLREMCFRLQEDGERIKQSALDSGEWRIVASEMWRDARAWYRLGRLAMAGAIYRIGIRVNVDHQLQELGKLFKTPGLDQNGSGT